RKARTRRSTDRMEHHHAVVGENLPAFGEKRIIEASAHMLEHADRNDAVEGAAGIAIVESLKGDLAGQPAFFSALACDCELLLRKRNAGDAGVAHLRCIERKPAPAAADVKKPMPLLDQQLCRQVPLLGELRIIEALLRSLEI